MRMLSTESATVTPLAKSGPRPLSASQSELWYRSQLASGSPVYNELIEIRKTGSLDVDVLRRAFDEVVARHEAWRTTFDTVDGTPHQFVHESMEVELTLADLSDLPAQEGNARAVEIAAGDMMRPYDLAEGPLIRPRLIRMAEDDHRLYIALHHLIWDGATLKRVVFPELIAFYRSYAAGLSSSLPDPEVQYSDYTAWELAA